MNNTENDLVIEITDANYGSIVRNNPLPILVDFWAEWCGPCKMMAPFMEILAKKLKGLVQIGKVDTEDNKTEAIMNSCSIISLPTFILFYEDKEIGRFIGTTTLTKLENFIEDSLQFYSASFVLGISKALGRESN